MAEWRCWQFIIFTTWITNLSSAPPPSHKFLIMILFSASSKIKVLAADIQENSLSDSTRVERKARISHLNSRLTYLCDPFVFQVLTYNGFYDSNLEWVGLEGVQIVASMNAGNTLGRHQLSSRFTSVVRICSIG